MVIFINYVWVYNYSKHTDLLKYTLKRLNLSKECTFKLSPSIDEQILIINCYALINNYNFDVTYTNKDQNKLLNIKKN